MTPALSVTELVDQGDLDELLRRIDLLCDEGDWDGLLDLRDRSRAAFSRGRQLWPAASHAEYRVALQAPGRWAASVVGAGAGQFSLGPLSEVAASTHAWRELAPHLPTSPEAALVAHERVVRGEDLTGEQRVDRAVLDLPLRLEPWEPAYPLAVYKPYTAEFADVAEPAGRAVEATLSPPGTGEVKPADDPEAVSALLELVTPWTTQSDGRASAVAVAGDALSAIVALAGDVTVRLTELDQAEALAIMAWAGASGGAHGRRRGMASGRFAAWWALAALAGELDRWPNVDAALGRLRWYRWERVDPSIGWILRLAAESPEDGRAWGLDATDPGVGAASPG